MECSRRLINAVWELTLRCNAHCAHCGSSAGTDRKDNLSDAEIMRICDELANLKCKTVALLGGEVFLHSLWREIVQKLRSLDIDVQIITNALSLNKEKFDFLSSQKIETLGISLDGSNSSLHDGIRNVPGLFKHIMSLSEDIEKNLLPTIAITTVTKKNIFDLPNMMKLVFNSFFCTWQIQIGHPFGRLSKDMALSELEFYIVGIFIALMQRRYKGIYAIFGMHDLGYYSTVIPDSVNVFNKNWHGCPAGKNVLGIRSNGKVVGCLSIYDDNYLEGDLRQQSLEEIWNSETFCSWNKPYNKYKKLQGDCKDCEYKFACCAGCSSSAISQTGSEFSVTHCFHSIEKKYKNYDGSNVSANLLKELVNGEISDNGYFIFKNGTVFNKDAKFEVNDSYYQKLLDILR